MARLLRFPVARPAPTAALALATLVATAACGSGGTGPTALLSQVDGGPLFLVQSEPATAVMEALFDGRIVVDQAGCIRLDIAEPEGATVVWPYGFTLETDGARHRVLDANGERVGVLGERFRFGGGFVSTLHEGIDMSADARAHALERCPGAYWIVGEVP